MTSTVPEITNDYYSITQLVLLVFFLIWFLQHVFECMADPFCQGLRERLEERERQLDESQDMIAYLNEELFKAETETLDYQVETDRVIEYLNSQVRSNTRPHSESPSASRSPPRTKQRTE